MNGALTLGSSATGRARLLRSFVLAAPHQLDHRRGSPLPLVRATLRGLDPADVRTRKTAAGDVATLGRRARAALIAPLGG